MILAYNHKAGQFAVGSRAGQECKSCHPGNVGKGLVHPFVNRLGALYGSFWLQGMQAVETGQGGNFLINLGIVLHSTAAKGIETGIHTEVHLREIGIVAYEVDFADLGKFGGCRAAKGRGKLLQAMAELVFRK